MLSPFYPYPPHGGALLRIWREIQFLGARHQLTLVCSAAESQLGPAPEELQAYCSQVYPVPGCQDRKGQVGAPDLALYHSSPEMDAICLRLAEEAWDVVMICGIHLASQARHFRAPVVLEEHNIESDLLRQRVQREPDPRARLGWKAQTMLLARFEQEHWPLFSRIFTVSRPDQQHIQQVCPQVPVEVMSNGCDTERALLELHGGRHRLLFSGRLDYAPNLEAVISLLDVVLPDLWRSHPQTRLRLAGAQPPSWLSQRVATDPRLELLANPEVMSECARDCSVLVVPLTSGSGSRLKILEALSWGLPVVTTPKGCEGLEVEDGVHLLIRDDCESLARAVLTLEEDGQQWAKLRREGRRLAEERYDWNLILERLEQSLLAAQY
jgi:glycosyltransferase involved in cell wall biosynthesis